MIRLWVCSALVMLPIDAVWLTLMAQPFYRVHIGHLLAPDFALAPAVAVISLDVGYLLGGIIVVEEVFAWPGLGRLMIHALQNRDLPVIQAVTLVLACVYALSNLVSDLVIAALDPRVRYA